MVYNHHNHQITVELNGKAAHIGYVEGYEGDTNSFVMWKSAVVITITEVATEQPALISPQ